VLNVRVPREACPFNLAPTASTTATLAMGDALAMAVLQARGFKRQDYARFHPSGAIGRALLLRVADITRGLLSFARQSVGLQSQIDFPQLLAETLIFMDHGFRKSNIDVVRSLGSQTRKFLGCAGELQQVFLNLFSNALDAMIASGRGTLSVTFREAAKYFEIVIADTGEGIPVEIQQKILEPFFSTKGVGKGTGLGLSISYGIVTKHKGTLAFSSNPGKGTTFTIRFPFEAPESGVPDSQIAKAGAV
jgi:signal transduction histidine kinase